MILRGSSSNWKKQIAESVYILSTNLGETALVFSLLFFFALCGLAVVATHLARERIPPPVAQELYSAVNRQLSDLRAADFESAYRDAATGVQQKFSRAFDETGRSSPWRLIISGSLMSIYSTSCAAALITKIRFPETFEVSRRSGSIRP